MGPSDRRRRVTIVALHFAEYAVRLAEALVANSDVSLILYDKNLRNELGPNWGGESTTKVFKCLILRRPRRPWAVVSNAARILKHIRDFRPDVIHYQGTPRDEVVLSLPFFGRYPKVLTVHDPVPHTGTDARRLRFSRYRLYVPWTLRSVDLALTHGEVLADELVRVAPWLRTKIRTVAHGPLGMEQTVAESSPPAGMRLLFFGRIHEYKGLRYFVEMVLKLHAEGLQVTGVVAGTGSDLVNYLPKMKASGCFEIIDRYVAAAEVSALFRKARVVVLPYIDGTQSGVAAMAMGYGRPVVASSVGAIPQLVRDRVNGLLVPPADTASLTRAVRSLLLDDVLWTELANGACALRDGELSWKAIADACGRVYEEANSRKRGRWSPPERHEAME